MKTETIIYILVVILIFIMGMEINFLRETIKEYQRKIEIIENTCQQEIEETIETYRQVLDNE